MHRHPAPDSHPEAGNLPVGHPDPRQAFPRLRGNTESLAHGDDELFQQPKVFMQILPAAAKDGSYLTLTFIRREWGHTASPISPARVKEVRDLTAGRTRPWTEAELLKIPD